MFKVLDALFKLAHTRELEPASIGGAFGTFVFLSGVLLCFYDFGTHVRIYVL